MMHLLFERNTIVSYSEITARHFVFIAASKSVKNPGQVGRRTADGKKPEDESDRRRSLTNIAAVSV